MPPPPSDSKRSSRGAVVIATTVSVAGLLAAWLLVSWRNPSGLALALIASVIIGALMTAIPIAICLVQTDSRLRQRDKLDRVAGERMRRTAYYSAARRSLEATAPSEFGPDYVKPMVLFALVILVGTAISLTVLFHGEQLSEASVLLGGMLAAYDRAGDDRQALLLYQKGTLVMACASFFGSYVSTLYRLLDRMGNNDLYPISFYYFSARFVIAMLTAATLRHFLGAIESTEQSQLLFVAGFLVGLAPDLFIVSMARRVFLWIKAFGYKEDPPRETWPNSLPLRMIDDLTNDKVDRLAELGIDTAQALACQNPLLIWTKLPHDLGLLVSWIAQAQLYALLREERLAKARGVAVRDIFDLQVRLADQRAVGGLLAALGLGEDQAIALAAQIEGSQAFQRLREVHEALIPGDEETARLVLAAQ